MAIVSPLVDKTPVKICELNYGVLVRDCAGKTYITANCDRTHYIIRLEDGFGFRTSDVTDAVFYPSDGITLTNG